MTASDAASWSAVGVACGSLLATVYWIGNKMGTIISKLEALEEDVGLLKEQFGFAPSPKRQSSPS